MKRGGFLPRKTRLQSKTGFKRRRPYNRSGSTIPRKSKTSVSKLKKTLWGLCRDITAQRYPPYCYTCGAGPLEGFNKQLGHFIASSICGAFLRYDLRNLRWQCMRCNQFAGGNGAEYYRRMVKEVGQEAVDTLFQDKERITKGDIHFIQAKIAEYQKLFTGSHQ